MFQKVARKEPKIEKLWQWVLGWNKNFQYIAAVSSSADVAKFGGVGFDGTRWVVHLCQCMCVAWCVAGKLGLAEHMCLVVYGSA